MDITFTETLRPDLIETGLIGLSKSIVGVEWRKSRAILNIDPIGPGRVQDVVGVFARLFNRMLVRVTDKPNFAAAVKWCWSSTETEYVFHLETDWQLSRGVSIDYLISEMRIHKAQAANIRAYGDDVKNRLCLSPVVMLGSVCRELASKLNTTDNPEAQFRDPSFRKGGRGLATNIKSFHWPAYPILNDIGAKWRKENGYGVSDSNFLTWEKRENRENL